MAVWDAVAKIAAQPLFRLLAERHGRIAEPRVLSTRRRLYYPGKGLSMLRARCAAISIAVTMSSR